MADGFHGDMLFLYTELIDGFLGVGLTGIQFHGGEIWMIRRVGEVLCLEADGGATGIGRAVGAFDTGKEVAGVELQTRFCGIYIERTAADGLQQMSGMGELALLFLIEHVVMVIAAAVLDLLVVGIVDMVTEGHGLTEVKRRAFYFPDLSRGDGDGIDGQIEISVELADDIVDRRGGVGDTGEGEEGVIREVDDCLLIRRSLIFDDQLIIISEGVSHPDLELTRETFLTIGTRQLEDAGLVVHAGDIPHTYVIAFLSAMEVVGSVIGSQLVFLTVEGELSLGDTVAITTDETAQIRLGRVDDIVDIIMAHNNIAEVAVFIGDHDGYEGTAEVGERHFMAFLVLEDVEVGLLTFYRGLEILSFQATQIFSFCRAHIHSFLVTLQ